MHAIAASGSGFWLTALGGSQRKAGVKPEQSRTCLNFRHALAVNPTEPVLAYTLSVRALHSCANFNRLLALVQAGYVVKGGRVNIKPYGGNLHFSARATCSLWTVPDSFPFCIHIVHPCFTLCANFSPLVATHNCLGCTPRQRRPCRDPGHRQTHRQTHPTQIVS